MQRQHLGDISATGYNLIPQVLTKFDDWLEQHPGYRFKNTELDVLATIAGIDPEDGGTEWYDIMYQKDEHGKECFVIRWFGGDSLTYNQMNRTKDIQVAVPLERIPQPAAVPKAAAAVPKPKARATPAAVPVPKPKAPASRSISPEPLRTPTPPSPKREVHPPKRYTPPSPKRAARVPPAAVPKAPAAVPKPKARAVPAAVPKAPDAVPKPKAQPPQPQRVRRRPVVDDDTSEVSEADVHPDQVFDPQHPISTARDEMVPLPYLKNKTITYIMATINKQQRQIASIIRATGCSYDEARRQRNAKNQTYMQQKGITDQQIRRERAHARQFQRILQQMIAYEQEHRDLHPEAYDEQ